MGRGPNRSTSGRRIRGWTVVLVAVGAAAGLLAPTQPAAAAVLPATTTTLFVNRTAALPGDDVTLTASVSVPSAPGTTASGSIAFKRGTTTIGTAELVGGTATLTTTDTPVGIRTFTAAFSSPGTLAASTSAARSVTIAKGASTTTMTEAATSAIPGEPVVLSAAVAGPDAAHPAAGTVTFKRGSTAIGTTDLVDGNATLIATLPAGALSVSATYQGSASLNGSMSSRVTVNVAQAASTTALTVDASLAGAPASFTAAVSSVGIVRTPTGKVTFRRGSAVIGVGDLDSTGRAHLDAALPAGPVTLTAVYGGSVPIAGSTSNPVAVDLQKPATTTVLSLDPSGFAPAGTPVTLSATTTVSDGRIPTGTITFKRGSTTIGSATLVDGVAMLPTTLPIGVLTITATYGGSTTLLASTSSAATLTVAKLHTFTQVSAPSAATFGQPVELTASVTVPSFERIPTGTVTFLRGTAILGSAPIDGTGTAHLTTIGLVAGYQTVTARYDGSSGLNSSTSEQTAIQVALAETSISVGSFAPPTAPGEPVALRATVTASAPSEGTPAGKVTFRTGTTVLGQVSLVGGVAELTTTALPAGTTSVTATYGGNASYLPSTVSFESALGAPTGVTAERGRGSAWVSFTPPAADGGSPITSYTVLATDQTDPEAEPVIATGWWPPIEVTGLTPGHAYVFTVRVENEAGATVTSEASDPIVPQELCPAVDGTTERSAAAPDIDWHGCNLADADLSGLDLSGANVSDAQLERANLTGTDLGGADLRRTSLGAADLEGADLDGTLLAQAGLSGVRSGSISGTPASLPSNWYLIDGYLVGSGAFLQDASLSGADLAGKIIGSSDFTGADLHGANLREAFMGFIILKDADLSGADLHGAYVLLADLRGADLRGADLTQAKLGGTNLTGADLTDADLTGADLSSPPPYPQIDLTGVVYCRTKMPSGEINNSGCPA